MGGGVVRGREPGRLIAAGRTSDVFEYGAGAVVKVPRPEVPAHWARLEADFTAAIRSHDVPAPTVLGVTEIDGRDSIVFEYLVGPTMWEIMRDEPTRRSELVAELARCHRRIFAAGPPDGLHGLVERLRRKVDDVVQITDDERVEVVGLVDELPKGAALLHGDLHPGNVLMTPDGPIAIDWFDASIGHPIADVVRTSLLMRAHGGSSPHLPGADADTLRAIHDEYIDAMSDVVAVDVALLRRWEATVAVTRLSEGDQPDGPGLLDIWRQRADVTGELVDAVSSPR